MALTKEQARSQLVIDGNPPEQRRRAARQIAGRAENAAECAELLAMLGLTPEDARRPQE